MEFVLVEVGGGGENGLDSWTGFEEGLRTDPNGSESSSRPEPKSEAASCTVLILSYARRFPRDAADPEAKRERTVGAIRVRRREDCALERLLSALQAARVERLLSVSRERREHVMRAMSV